MSGSVGPQPAPSRTSSASSETRRSAALAVKLSALLTHRSASMLRRLSRVVLTGRAAPWVHDVRVAGRCRAAGARDLNTAPGAAPLTRNGVRIRGGGTAARAVGSHHAPSASIRFGDQLIRPLCAARTNPHRVWSSELASDRDRAASGSAEHGRRFRGCRMRFSRRDSKFCQLVLDRGGRDRPGGVEQLAVARSAV